MPYGVAHLYQSVKNGDDMKNANCFLSRKRIQVREDITNEESKLIWVVAAFLVSMKKGHQKIKKGELLLW